MSYLVYILKSEVTGKHYYGHSGNLEARLARHNQGQVRSTKAGKPWKIIYTESFESKAEAYQREKFFKTIDGYNWLKDQCII
jgi:putative endonuclease